MSLKTSRRDFLKAAGVGVAAGSLAGAVSGCVKPEPVTIKDGYKRLNLGMASYTLRKFNLDDTLAITNRVGLKHICFKSMHLPLESTEEEIKAVVEKVKAAGLNLYGCGVVSMRDENQVNQAFDYAKAAGMSVIVGYPEPELLDIVDKKVQEYDIKVALHNHGPEDKNYANPIEIYEKIKNLDTRLGFCLDIGHVKRSGIDPSEAAIKIADRLHDVHVKDITKPAEKYSGTPTELGRGILDIPRFLRTLLKINYTGKISLEYEKSAGDPLPGAAESIGYLKGVLSVI